MTTDLKILKLLMGQGEMVNKEYCGFKIGDRVKIISSKSKYEGYLGTVSRLNVGYYGYIAIHIDGTIYKIYGSYAECLREFNENIKNSSILLW